MKKVLIITYYWPPAGGPGVQRMLKLVKYLPELGWEPIILTVKNGDYQAIDLSLEKEIPPGIKVFKSTILEPYSIYRKLAGLKKDDSFDIAVLSDSGKKTFKKRIIDFVWKNFFVPDAKIGWIPFAVWKGVKIARKEKVDAIMSTSPPYTVSVIANRVRFWTGKKWLADFRDPWTGYLISPERKFIAAWWDRRLEKKVFRKCHKFTVAWPGIIDNFHKKYPKVSLDKTTFIPNGYDFDVESREGKKVDNEQFVLTYSGSLYGKRYPKKFVEILGELVKENPLLKKYFVLQVIGRTSKDIAIHLKDNLGENIKLISYLPHEEMLEKMQETTALWLVMDDVPEAKYIVAGKTYEYIGLQKPILGCLPEGSQSEKIIMETGTGVRIDQNDKQEAAEVLLDWVSKWKEGQPMVQFNMEEINKYHRKHIAKQFADQLNEMVES